MSVLPTTSKDNDTPYNGYFIFETMSRITIIPYSNVKNIQLSKTKNEITIYLMNKITDDVYRKRNHYDLSFDSYSEAKIQFHTILDHFANNRFGGSYFIRHDNNENSSDSD